MQKINFSGGEPFIEGRHGKFVGEMVRYCKQELGLSVSIVSNGSLIKEQWFKDYGKHGQGRIARALIGGRGGVYSYTRVMPDEFLLKSVVFKLISKEISRAEHEYMNIHPPPPPPPPPN